MSVNHVIINIKNECPQCHEWKDRRAKTCRSCKDALGDTKICTKCKQDLPLSNFSQIEGKTGLRPRPECFPCAAQRSEKWRKQNPKRKLYNYLRAMELEDEVDEIYELMCIQKQCTICHKQERNGYDLSVDHDHVTGKFRGLLCSKCNRGIGLFEDNIDNLFNAIEYIKKSKLS